MKQTDFERIVAEAVRIMAKSEDAEEPSTPCLSDETLRSICEATLPDSQRDCVINHLRECDRCRKGLKLYLDLAEHAEKSKASAKYDIKLLHNGKLSSNPQIHWLMSGRTFEVWDIKQAGKYELVVGSKSIEVDCKQRDIIRGPKETRYRKTGATDDKTKFSKETTAPDGSISVLVFPGRHTGRFYVTIH
jgi:hypothetical protein